MTAGGRVTAFDAIFDEHRGWVHSYLLGRTGDRSSAQDLLQETFVRVWRRVDEVSQLESDSQRAWICTAARNLVTDGYRSGATAAVRQDALRADTARRGPDRISSDPAQTVLVADELARVSAAIAALPEPLRVALTMHALGELTSAQIGATLGVPAGTIRYRISQARRALAAALESGEERISR